MPTKKHEESPLDRFRRVFVEINTPKGGLPTMPTKIADVASDELGDMIARYTAWREFTEDRHAEACATYAQCKSEYDLEVDKAVLRVEGQSVTERKAKANSDPQVEILYKRVSESNIYRELLANKLDSFSNVLAMLSRELTRRGVTNM